MKQNWKASGVDLRCAITPRILSVPGLVDIFEMVQDCEPISKITRKAGGAKAVLRKDLLVEHLRENIFVPSPDDCAACLMALMCLKSRYLPIYRYLRRTLCEPVLLQSFAPEIFADSLLAACLLQKVVGVGDRHNDNVFLSKRGELFLAGIDHILGNYKSKFGIKRERPVFFVTPQLDFVLETHGLKERFLEKFARAHLVLRERKHDIMTLLFAMRDSGCMELQTTQDMSSYMEFAFCSGMSDEDAVRMVRDQYVESLQSKTTGNFVHILAH
jgi:hypothetical protein